MVQGPQVIGWDGRDFREVRVGIFSATVNTLQPTVTLYRSSPRPSWEVRQHTEDQVVGVLDGEIDFTNLRGRVLNIITGQAATLPGGTPHSPGVPAGAAVNVDGFRLRTGA